MTNSATVVGNHPLALRANKRWNKPSSWNVRLVARADANNVRNPESEGRKRHDISKDTVFVDSFDFNTTRLKQDLKCPA